MVVMDSTVLLLLFQPSAKPPLDPARDAPVTQCKDPMNSCKTILKSPSSCGKSPI